MVADMETAQSLKLSIRSNGDTRYIDLKLLPQSLMLALLMGIMTVFMYEMVWVVALLWRRDALKIQEDDRARRNSKTTAKAPFLLAILLASFAISNLYAIFYSFEVLFLYLNDRWYDLLAVQTILTTMDTVVWSWWIMTVKYSWCGTTTFDNPSSLGLSRPVQIIFGLEISHLIFNATAEAGVWKWRHLLFLLEDLTSVMMILILYRPDWTSVRSVAVWTCGLTWTVVGAAKMHQDLFSFRIT